MGVDVEPPLRPSTLTYKHAWACLPGYEVNPEWKRKSDAGELEDGFMGICGMLRQTPAEERLTHEEAMWVLALHDIGSMRWVAGMVFNDDNQIYGDDIIEAARSVMKDR
jgi:hypothetical protein